MSGKGPAVSLEPRTGLRIMAQSIAKAPTEFVIDVFVKRKPHLEGKIVPGVYAPELDQDFVMRITNGSPVEPGHFVMIQSQGKINAPLDKMFWYVPPDRRGRFVVQELTFDGAVIVLKAGVV